VQENLLEENYEKFAGMSFSSPLQFFENLSKVIEEVIQIKGDVKNLVDTRNEAKSAPRLDTVNSEETFFSGTVVNTPRLLIASESVN
jgi:hypothetical protein